MNRKCDTRLIFLIDLQNCYLSPEFENTYISRSPSVLNNTVTYLKEKKTKMSF